MDDNNITKNDVSGLIDRLLECNDPASVGLKRILRKKMDDVNEFPLHSPKFESFESPARKGIFSEDERTILELEKKILELESNARKKEQITRTAIQNAYANGLQKGLEEGTELGKKRAGTEFQVQIDTFQGEISTLLTTLQNSKKRMIHDSEKSIVKLCTGIAKKIVCSELTTREELVLGVVKQALGTIAEREKLIIRISPADKQIVVNGKEFWASVNERLENITIEEDERIERGGCIIESSNGIADARIGVQTDEIDNLITKIWDHGQSES